MELVLLLLVELILMAFFLVTWGLCKVSLNLKIVFLFMVYTQLSIQCQVRITQMTMQLLTPNLPRGCPCNHPCPLSVVWLWSVSGASMVFLKYARGTISSQNPKILQITFNTVLHYQSGFIYIVIDSQPIDHCNLKS